MHGHERPITHLKYSPDGDVFFSASKDSTPTMWRAKDGERLGVFYGHNGSVFQLDTTSNLELFLLTTPGDTKYLISAATDATSNIWEVNTGKLVNTIKFDCPVRAVAVSEGDQYVCICSTPFSKKPVSFYRR